LSRPIQQPTTPDRALTVTVLLRDRVPQLATVTINGEATVVHTLGPADVGGFYDRMKKGIGHFITPEDVERIKPLRTSDLLRTIPGGAGPCVPSVLVNGIPVKDGAKDMDNLVSSMDVAAVEVYQTAETPVEDSGTKDSMCGAIGLWTH
jgi:hypothetical protein